MSLCFFGFFTDSSRFLYMCIIYKMPSFGILLVTFIVWMFAISISVGSAWMCKASSKGCPSDIKFNIYRYSSIIYVFLLPILTIIGFTAETSVPLIAFIFVWIMMNILLNLKEIGDFFKHILLL